MDDLISRRAAIDAAIEATDSWDGFCSIGRQKRIENCINSLPSALSTNLAEVGTDCISRQDAIDALRDYLVGKRCPDDGTLTCRLIENEVISKLPPIQPKRGKWIHHPEIGWGETWLCDQCGEKTTSTVMGKPRANFCPNCGAKMEVTE